VPGLWFFGVIFRPAELTEACVPPPQAALRRAAPLLEAAVVGELKEGCRLCSDVADVTFCLLHSRDALSLPDTMQPKLICRCRQPF